jgi:drug/metabolite transporter (DMT)-like permease
LSAVQTDHSKGLLIAAIGGLALTFDIPLIRLADGDAWPILMFRSGLTFFATLAVVLLLRAAGRTLPPLIPGRAGALVSVLYSIGSITFMLAVFNTATANLVFILAFNPMFAALLSWLFFGERPRPATLLAMAAMLFGVLIIVGEGISAGHFLGDMLAVTTALLLASAITVSRASGKDMGFTALISAVGPFLIAAAITWETGYRVEVPWWIVFNGVLVIPLSFFCLAAAPKYISGPEVAMFYLLETVLAPVWVWMIFAEAPSAATLAGGVILIVTLVLHSLWQLHDGRRRRAAQAVRHPA